MDESKQAPREDLAVEVKSTRDEVDTCIDNIPEEMRRPPSTMPVLSENEDELDPAEES